MDKFMEFLKNNTAVVAVAAGIVLFIAMNGITSCVAKGGGNDAPADAQEQLEQKSEQPSHKGDAADSKTELTERQRSAIRDYDQATKQIVEQIENSKWAANDGSGSMTIKDGIITDDDTGVVPTQTPMADTSAKPSASAQATDGAAKK